MFYFIFLYRFNLKNFSSFFDAIGPFFSEQDIILGCFNNLN